MRFSGVFKHVTALDTLTINAGYNQVGNLVSTKDV